QAEDGIRDLTVTGVQTCALPISVEARARTARAETRRTGHVSSNPHAWCKYFLNRGVRCQGFRQVSDSPPRCDRSVREPPESGSYWRDYHHRARRAGHCPSSTCRPPCPPRTAPPNRL